MDIHILSEKQYDSTWKKSSHIHEYYVYLDI